MTVHVGYVVQYTPINAALLISMHKVYYNALSVKYDWF